MTRKKGPEAVAYLRVSGRGQVGGDGFPRQRDACRRYARQHGLDLGDEYRDEGVSGTKELDFRPGLSALVERIRSNGVRIVLVERADRLARDLIAGELILGELRGLGVQVIAADSGTDLTVADDDPTRKLIRQVLGAVAEFEKSILVAKLRAARIRRRRAGQRVEGVKPYGSQPGESNVVGIMRTLRRKPRGRSRQPGQSFQGIADELNRRGIPSRHGRPWRASTVQAILKRTP